jgi:N-acetylglucosaminyl-diphospho-decaprenol L-rhamnosyltransferase
MSLHEHPAVTAVVVHFGPTSATERTLQSLQRHAPGLPVLVVDNDGAFARIHGGSRREGLEILSPGKNLGYGAACNLGARHTAGAFVLFLNNDTELDASTIPRLVDVLESEPRVAVAGPRLRDGSGKPVPSIGRAPTPRRILFENLFLPRCFPGIPFFHGHHTARISHRRVRDVETLSGAAFLIRRAAFNEVGGFDERYFFFVEETDLFERLRRKGWRIRFDPASTAVHHGGVASSTLDVGILDRLLHHGFRTYARTFHGAAGERRTVRALSVGATLRWLLSHLQPGPAGRERRRRYAALRQLYRHPRHEHEQEHESDPNKRINAP